MGSRTVCFIDHEGNTGVCTVEMLDENQIVQLMGNNVIDCNKCEFKKKYEGKEYKHFGYTNWTGEIK